MISLRKSIEFSVLVLVVSCGSKSSQDSLPEIPDEPEVVKDVEKTEPKTKETVPNEVASTVEIPAKKEATESSDLESSPEEVPETVAAVSEFVSFDELMSVIDGGWKRCELQANGLYFGVVLSFDVDASQVSETWSFDYTNETCTKISEDVAVMDGPRETTWDFDIELNESIAEGVYSYDQEWTTDFSTKVYSALSIKNEILYLAHPGVGENPDGMTPETRATNIDWSKPHYKQ